MVSGMLIEVSTFVVVYTQHQYFTRSEQLILGIGVYPSYLLAGIDSLLTFRIVDDGYKTEATARMISRTKTAALLISVYQGMVMYLAFVNIPLSQHHVTDVDTS
jgi:hypothetical protein